MIFISEKCEKCAS